MKKKVMLLVALLPLLVMAAPKKEAKQPTGRAEVIEPTRFEYRMAKQALRNQDLQMAWDYLRQDRYLNPQSGWPVAEAANLMYYTQAFDDAEKSAMDALKLLPKKCSKTAEMNCLLAYCRQVKSDTAQAIRYFQTAIKAAPDSVQAYLGLADIYNAKNQFKQEEKVLDELKRVAPGLSLAYLYGCRNYEFQGKPILAIKDGKRALELDSTDLQIHSFLATAYFDTDCPLIGCKEVVTAMKNPRISRAIRQFFTYGMIYENEMERAVLEVRENPLLHDYYTSMFADLQITMSQYIAQSDSAQTEGGQVEIQLRRAKALAYYLQLNEPSAADLYNLACLYSLRNEKEQAIQYLRRSVEAGYDNKEWAMQDGDLFNLHLMPEYLDLLQKMTENKQNKQINQ